MAFGGQAVNLISWGRDTVPPTHVCAAPPVRAARWSTPRARVFTCKGHLKRRSPLFRLPLPLPPLSTSHPDIFTYSCNFSPRPLECKSRKHSNCLLHSFLSPQCLTQRLEPGRRHSVSVCRMNEQMKLTQMVFSTSLPNGEESCGPSGRIEGRRQTSLLGKQTPTQG